MSDADDGAGAPESLRLFVSIPLDDTTRKAMRRLDWWVDHLDGFRKVPPGNRHVTVVFLGDVASDQFERLIDSIGEPLDSQRTFVMPIEGVIAMPSERRQRALAVGLGAESGFASLERSVRSAVGAVHPMEADDRPPRPHITFARRKRTGGGRVDTTTAPPIVGEVFCATVELVRSELTGQGPIYTPLARWALRDKSDC